MEEKLFDAFATILDLCSAIGDRLIIPEYYPFNERPIPNCPLGDKVSPRRNGVDCKSAGYDLRFFQRFEVFSRLRLDTLCGFLHGRFAD
jgi:hypothetical protein